MRKRRIGSNCLCALLLLTGLAVAGQKTKQEAPRGVVAGTIFREPGFAFPGATVKIVSLPESGSSEKPLKEKTVSNERGEFAFRVAPVEMHYKVSVQAKGFQSQEKTVEIRGEERVEATFMLQEESK